MTEQSRNECGSTMMFDREQERESLSQRLQKRHSLLVHGPTGVGKTTLLMAIIRCNPSFLYSPDSTTANTVCRSLATRLWHLRAPRLVTFLGRGGLEAIKTKSAASLKGVVFDALRQAQYWVVLDHIRRPSYAFSAVVREMIGWCRTPVVTVARSAHMEDTGFLQPLYPDRSDRFELKNFDPETAQQFASSLVELANLSAENTSEFLERVLEYSGGNPGAIRAMLQLATQPQYRADGRIKITPLYIDFRLRWNAATLRSAKD